jgi:hypothetical protein
MNQYKLLVLSALMGCFTSLSSAQLVLTDFLNFTSDASFVYADEAQWVTGSTLVESGGNAVISGGNGFGNLQFEFIAPQNYSGYTSVELQVSITSGNTSDINFFIQNASFTDIATATFNTDSLAIGTYTLTVPLNITGALASSFLFGVAGDGNPTTATRFTLNNLALIPEPSTYALLLIGGAALVALRRKQAVKA